MFQGAVIERLRKYRVRRESVTADAESNVELDTSGRRSFSLCSKSGVLTSASMLSNFVHKMRLCW